MKYSPFGTSIPSTINLLKFTVPEGHHLDNRARSVRIQMLSHYTPEGLHFVMRNFIIFVNIRIL